MNTAMGSLLSVIESLGENGFLVEIAILIIAAFLGGKLASLVRMPEVLGQILAGILVGPTVLGWKMCIRDRMRSMPCRPVCTHPMESAGMGPNMLPDLARCHCRNILPMLRQRPCEYCKLNILMR